MTLGNFFSTICGVGAFIVVGGMLFAVFGWSIKNNPVLTPSDPPAPLGGSKHKTFTEEEILMPGVDIRSREAVRQIAEARRAMEAKTQRVSAYERFFGGVEVRKVNDPISGTTQLVYVKRGKPSIEHHASRGRHTLYEIHGRRQVKVYEGDADGAADHLEQWKRS
jgi:hypothetical protein